MHYILNKHTQQNTPDKHLAVELYNVIQKNPA